MSASSDRPPAGGHASATAQPRGDHAGVRRNPDILTASTLTERLRALAHQARRLPPADHRHPEHWHEARDELAEQLRVLADQVKTDFR